MNLLQKRFKVVADYPDNDIPVGIVLTNYSSDIWTNMEKGYEFHAQVSWFEKYPHLFREMSWWEERELKDLPEYVKWNQLRVKGTIERAIEYVDYGYGLAVKVGSQSMSQPLKCFDPSTQAEFLEQEKSKG